MISTKSIVLVLFIFLFMQNILFAQHHVVIYGDESYPPYSYSENGQAKGIYVDILKLAFSKMTNYEVTLKTLPWKRALRYIKSGEAFALYPPYHTQQRLPWMSFSEPILQEEIVVFGKEQNLKGKTKWPEDFYGHTIGLNRGFSPYALGGVAFGDAFQAKKIKTEEANTTEQNFKKLERERFPFYINDKFLDISPYPSIKKGMTVNINFGHLGFTKQNDNYKFITDFKNTFDQIIKDMKESNEIKKILDKYIY